MSVRPIKPAREYGWYGFGAMVNGKPMSRTLPASRSCLRSAIGLEQYGWLRHRREPGPAGWRRPLEPSSTDGGPWPRLPEAGRAGDARGTRCITTKYKKGKRAQDGHVSTRLSREGGIRDYGPTNTLTRDYAVITWHRPVTRLPLSVTRPRASPVRYNTRRVRYTLRVGPTLHKRRHARVAALGGRRGKRLLMCFLVD